MPFSKPNHNLFATRKNQPAHQRLLAIEDEEEFDESVFYGDEEDDEDEDEDLIDDEDEDGYLDDEDDEDYFDDEDDED